MKDHFFWLTAKPLYEAFHIMKCFLFCIFVMFVYELVSLVFSIFGLYSHANKTLLPSIIATYYMTFSRSIKWAVSHRFSDHMLVFDDWSLCHLTRPIHTNNHMIQYNHHCGRLADRHNISFEIKWPLLFIIKSKCNAFLLILAVKAIL